MRATTIVSDVDGDNNDYTFEKFRETVLNEIYRMILLI